MQAFLTAAPATTIPDIVPRVIDTIRVQPSSVINLIAGNVGVPICIAERSDGTMITAIFVDGTTLLPVIIPGVTLRVLDDTRTIVADVLPTQPSITISNLRILVN